MSAFQAVEYSFIKSIAGVREPVSHSTELLGAALGVWGQESRSRASHVEELETSCMWGL